MKRLQFTSDNVAVINFDNNKIPSFTEERSKDYIKFGEKNDYPEYLIQNFNRSAKHNAIITGKVHYISGGGITVDSESTSTEEEAVLLDWIDKMNFDSLLPRLATDLELFNGFYLEIIPSMDGSISEINHIGFEKIRINKNRDGFFYSNDWTRYRQSYSETGLKPISKYNHKTKSGLFHYKAYRPGNNVYPLPEYIGCIPYIEIDYEISNYHLNNVKNGFVGGTLLSFNNGVPNKEEKPLIEEKVKRKFTGSDNAGQLMITFSQNKDSAPTVTPLMPNDFDKQFVQLNDTVMQEIFTGHKITSLSLFGIKEASGLGSKDELQQAFSLFQNGYISTKQRILERILNDICEAAGFKRCIKIVKTAPIESTVPEERMYGVMTSEEIREKAGLKPLDQSGKMSQQFHNHFSIESFKNIGENKSGFTVLKSNEVFDSHDVKLKEINFYKDKSKFLEYDKVERGILDLVSKDSKITINELARSLNETSEDIQKVYDSLIEKKLLQITGSDSKLTTEAERILEADPITVEKVEVLYSYEVRSGLPSLKTESRDFCQELMALNKFYTREEIEKISRIEGRDVWATRGGYYHNSKLNQTTPYCRHIWKQNVVRRN